jgi:hypothetical protein
MKKESELNAVETFAMFGFACAAGAVAVGLALKKLTTTKVFNYGYQSTPEEINELMK